MKIHVTANLPGRKQAKIKSQKPHTCYRIIHNSKKKKKKLGKYNLKLILRGVFGGYHGYLKLSGFLGVAGVPVSD